MKLNVARIENNNIPVLLNNLMSEKKKDITTALVFILISEIGFHSVIIQLITLVM